MFELKGVIVEDKKLAAVLRALDGLVMAPGPVPIPIRAAKAQNGEVVSTQPHPGAPLYQQVVTYLATKGWQQFTYNQFLEAAAVAGSRNAPALIARLKGGKLVKQISGPKRGRANDRIFTLLQPKTKEA